MSADQQTWDRLRAGEHAALADIYEAHVDALFRYGCQFTRDEGLVEDAIQDLFVELWKNHAGLGTNDGIRQYLLVALRRKIGRTAKQQLQRQEKLQVIIPQETTVTYADEALLAQEEQSQAKTQIERALAQLSSRQREILYLKYFEELNYKQIGELIGINHQSVRNTASAGLKALRKILQSWWWMGTLFLIKTLIG